nr:MAG: DNA-binding protein containing wHTH domain [uncultured archaeon]
MGRVKLVFKHKGKKFIKIKDTAWELVQYFPNQKAAQKAEMKTPHKKRIIVIQTDKGWGLFQPAKRIRVGKTQKKILQILRRGRRDNQTHKMILSKIKGRHSPIYVELMDLEMKGLVERYYNVWSKALVWTLTDMGRSMVV